MKTICFEFSFFLFKVKCLLPLVCKNVEKVLERKTLQVLNKRMPLRMQSANSPLRQSASVGSVAVTAMDCFSFLPICSIYPDHISSVFFSCSIMLYTHLG